jgi:regulation of enolase protein 1 (concanavalin A-like superfamily)
MRRQTVVAMIFCLSACMNLDSAWGQQRISGWGQLIDLDGDCTVKADDERVLFTVIGWHDLSDDLPKNAPRILEEVEGDFVVFVKVGGAFKPVGPSTLATRRPYNGAGLLIWQDDKNYVRLERAAVEVNGQTPEYLNFQQHTDGAVRMARIELGLKPEPVHIRLERRNGRLHAAASYDSRLWNGYPPVDVRLPGKLQLGVAAISTSATAFTPEFEEFEVYRRTNLNAKKVQNQENRP